MSSDMALLLMLLIVFIPIKFIRSPRERRSRISGPDSDSLSKRKLSFGIKALSGSLTLSDSLSNRNFY